MAPLISNNWKCRYIQPQLVSLAEKLGAHIVGPIPNHRLQEIAVPDHPTSDSPCYIELSEKGRVSIESLMSQELIDMHGQVIAYQLAHLNFAKRIWEGIAQHGTSLAEYYQKHYNSMTPWIEYILLFEEFSKIKLDPTAAGVQRRQDFEKAIIFIIHLVTPSDDQLLQQIEHIGPAAVIERLQERLEHEFEKPQPSPNLIIMVRMLLSCVGATKPVSHLRLLGQQELHFPKAIYQLMGGCQTEDLRSVTQPLIDKNSRRLGIVTWSYIPEFPPHLISSISESTIHCLGYLLDFVSDVKLDPISRDNLHKLLAISICLDIGSQKLEADHLSFSEMHKINFQASQSLKQATETAQMAVDLLTMVCIAQRYTSLETSRRPTTPFCALHRIFAGGAPCTSLPSPDCYILSFIEACKQNYVRQDIVDFLGKCLGTPCASAKVDVVLVSYFSCRMDGRIHDDAMEELSIEIHRPEDIT